MLNTCIIIYNQLNTETDIYFSMGIGTDGVPPSIHATDLCTGNDVERTTRVPSNRASRRLYQYNDDGIRWDGERRYRPSARVPRIGLPRRQDYVRRARLWRRGNSEPELWRTFPRPLCRAFRCKVSDSRCTVAAGR